MASNHEDRRRKMAIASSSSFLLLLLVVGMVAVSMNQAEEKPTSKTGTIRSSTKSVKAICASTDYKQTCEKSLIKLAHNTTSDPKEILKAAIVAVIDEISTSFSHSTLFKSNDSRVQDAIDDCWEMYQDSKEDLVKTLNKIIDTGLGYLPGQTLSLKSWLSATLFYQQTCVDGFPEGEHKNEMRRAMRTTKELTRNALVLVGHVSEFVSMLGIQSFGRRLLSVEDQQPVVKRGYPSWVSDGDRRLLKEHLKIKLKPNVTVAQDGSGDFRTINEAIRRMPLKYHGRLSLPSRPPVSESASRVGLSLPCRPRPPVSASRVDLGLSSRPLVSGLALGSGSLFPSHHLFSLLPILASLLRSLSLSFSRKGWSVGLLATDDCVPLQAPSSQH